MATSVPVPMAMPTSACASAGASLMPSPTMATFLPSACNRSTSLDLILGPHLGEDPVYAELAGDRRRGAPVVAGEHGDLQSQRVQSRDRLPRLVPDRVGDRNETGRLAVDGDEHRRLASDCELLAAREQAVLGDVRPFEEASVAGQDLAPLDRGPHAAPGRRPRSPRRRPARAHAPSRPGRWPRQRVLAVRARAEATSRSSSFSGIPSRGDHVRQPRARPS